MGTNWSFIVKRGTHCCELRIANETQWSLMGNLGMIVVNSVFLYHPEGHLFLLIMSRAFPKGFIVPFETLGTFVPCCAFSFRHLFAIALFFSFLNFS